MRQKNITNLLVSKELLPSSFDERAKLFAELDPYPLRKAALDKKLEPFELGRVLYHLCKRRGFQSNRKAGSSDDNKISAAVSELSQEIEAAHSRTLGEYLDSQSKKRNRYTDRAMYLKEFNSIWQTQRAYYSDLLTPEFNLAVHKAIFFQRPLKIQKYLVGKCTFEPSRKRASKALLECQRFRMLTDLNNLAIKNPITREYRPLQEAERIKILNLLEMQKTVSWGKARKTLGLHESEVFNLEEGKKSQLIGNRTSYALRSILENQWDDLTVENKNALITDMLTIDYEQGFLNRMKSHWKFPDEIAEKLAKTELEPGYANLSLKAINKIMPFLEQGKLYSDACLAAGYNHSAPGQLSIVDKLGEPPYLRNPVVQKALFETRKLVNAIIRQHGKPSVVRVEMVREMKLSKKQKEIVEKRQNLQKKANEAARKILEEEFKIQNPTRQDVQKYNLWKECNAVCPYTGVTISGEMLFSPEIDIEHIIPYSRSLDDSYMNKTLCRAGENRGVKKNKTPYEAYHANESKYLEILQRVKDLPSPKLRKFEQKEVNTDEFVKRQLNDTRYISREVKNYLGQLGVSVEISKGMATAALRRQWLLNKILNDNNEKNRGDHRHHAVDAIVIALTSQSLFQKISHLSSQNGRALSEGLPIDNPWPAFYDEAADKIQNIIVSHAPSRKISGALHEETAYGYSEHEGYFVYRKPLSNLTAKEIDKIRDQKIKELIKNRLAEHNGDLKNAFADDNNPLFHVDGKTPINSVRLRVNINKDSTHPVKNQDSVQFKYFKYGNNHHVEIIESVKTGKRQGIFVTSMEAAKRVRMDKLLIVSRDHGPDWKFLMSLSSNDMIEIDENGEPKYYRVQKLDGSNEIITLRYHTASKLDNKEEVLYRTPNTLKGKKITIDCLGVITPCND